MVRVLALQALEEVAPGLPGFGVEPRPSARRLPQPGERVGVDLVSASVSALRWGGPPPQEARSRSPGSVDPAAMRAAVGGALGRLPADAGQ
jgi:hypothetical protein